MSGQVLSLEEAAERMGVRLERVIENVRLGGLPAFRRADGSWALEEDEVASWAAHLRGIRTPARISVPDCAYCRASLPDPDADAPARDRMAIEILLAEDMRELHADGCAYAAARWPDGAKR